MTEEIIYDPELVPLGMDPAEWAYICRRYHRHRLLLRSLLIALLVAPVAWVGWRVLNPPLDAQQHYAVAEEKLTAGDMSAALLSIKSSLVQEPRSAAARRLAGRIYLQFGAYPDARKEFGRAKELGEKDPVLDVEIATALLYQGEFRAATDFLAASPLRTAAHAEWQALRGDALLGLNEPERARDLYALSLQAEAKLPRALRGLARLAFEEGKVEDAATGIDSALDADPAAVDGWLLKGDIALATKRFADAEAAFKKAVALNPYRKGALVGFGRALLAQRKTDEADAQARAILRLAPQDAWGHYLRGGVALQREQLDVADDAFEQAIKRDPDHAETKLLLGELLAQRGQHERAGELLGTYLARHPNNLRAVKSYARVQMQLGAPDEAIAALTGVAREALADPEMTALLGAAYLDTGSADAAVALLEKASKAAPDDAGISRRLAISYAAKGDLDRALEAIGQLGTDAQLTAAHLEIARSLLAQGEVDKALELTGRLTHDMPESPEAFNLNGIVQEAAGKRAAAVDSFEKALALAPDSIPARINLARRALAEGDAATARQRYDEVLHRQPGNSQALVALAKLDGAAGKPLKDVVARLQQAVDNNPGATEAQLILANHHLGQRKLEAALRHAEAAVKSAPAQPLPLMTLARCQLAMKQPEKAIASLKKAAALAPESKRTQQLLALAYAQKGDEQALRASLDSLIEGGLDPATRRIVQANLAFEAGDTDTALAAASEMKKTPGQELAGLTMEGSARLAREEYDAAIAAYRKAFELKPDPRSLAPLYNALAQAGRTAEAEKALTDWLLQHPDDVAVRSTLAYHYRTQDRPDDARREYERALQAQPDNVLVLNNLAWLLDAQGDKQALAHAAKAHERMPDRVEIMDTYGWMQVRYGKLELGLAMVKKAAAKAPADADIQYHYAAALVEAKDTAAARRILDALLAKSGDFPSRAAAEELLKKLG
jgi:putative PEP-CTERM system TPR-repeat lipoprotein